MTTFTVTSDIEAFAYGIAAEHDLAVTYPPCGMSLHTDSGMNLGIITEGHSIALYVSAKGRPGLTILQAQTVAEAEHFIAQWASANA